uniref:4-vinyl reductase 4VR domain-containing protein n=1 Tax=Candidatus Methanophagaceae archaeon ANME-1 ERB6 TaxID=2759912 RepID=A0A7G9YXB3_9EURY|nr:hypothetical protein CKMLAADM_00012 [Methanosarcinales archaeon ANME-1 ERB6]QNO52679.1 hypothetical protein OOKFEKOF_00018 [Methanosarcinales archaeon ANME-1 ERB6]
MGVEREDELEGLIDKLWWIFLDKVRKKYLFSWDSVPGDDDEKLKQFLRDDLDISWAEDVEINKSDDDKTIYIFKDENSAEIKIDKKKEIATLKIRGGRTRDLIVKKEEGKLNIYGRKKKRGPGARSAELGDEVDLFLPQIRALFLMRNPKFPEFIYGPSCRGARRNALTILDNVETLPDLFCYLVYKKNDKSLSRLINMLFREIMEINKEGLLSVENVYTDPPEHIKIALKLKECAECFGVEANHPICYHHAGTLTGIVSALWGKKLYGYETECCAAGGDNCEFIIETNSEEHEKYLNPGKIDFSLHKRLEDTLDRKIHRSIGDEIDLRYYQLVILNSLIENPTMFRESSHLGGIDYGKELASFLQAHYNKKGEELFDVISRYYRCLKHLRIEIKKGADEIRAKEVAEISGLPKNELFLGFLFGELESLFSAIRKEVVIENKAFENDDLVITFKKQE